MSLLEDVFLEDEAGEAQELERVIEGDEFDERPRSRSDSDENSAKEDEAEEDKRRVDPTSAKPKRVIKNPRFVLNPARLTGPRGIQVVTEHFKDFKFKGKGHEREDLDLVLKKLEHWAYRLYPKFEFEDCLKKIETLGKKRAVAVHLHRIRTDQITSDETVVQKDSSDDEAPPVQESEEDEFDKLLQQQIEIARATPAPSSVKKTPFSDRSLMMPKATSSPSINDEQRERMLKNRRMAEERRLARLKQTQENFEENGVKSIIHVGETRKSIDHSDDDMNKSVTENNYTDRNVTVELDDDGMVVTKSAKTYAAKNKSTIDLSDDVTTESVTVDIHDSNNHDIVELDNDGKVVTKSPKQYVPAKKHNKSIIDSSDDENDHVINEPITVDVDKHHDDKLIKTKNISDKFSNLDSSDSDEVTSKSMTVGADHHVKKHNRSNIIDSSDSEDEAVVMNESITVDIHDSNKHTNESNRNVTMESNKENSKQNDSVFDSLKGNTEDENDVSIDPVENQNISSHETNNSPEINDEIETTNVLPETSTNIDETKHNDNDEDGENEIMDVDFGDDF